MAVQNHCFTARQIFFFIISSNFVLTFTQLPAAMWRMYVRGQIHTEKTWINGFTPLTFIY